MARFMDEGGQAALKRAVETIEAGSAAEVVIAVRPRAHVWLVPAIGTGMVAAAASLAYALWSEREFDLWAIFWLPAVVGVAAAFVVLLPPIYRLLLPKPIRDEHVVQAGRAAFHAQNVHSTHGRTGLLVYISLLERRVLLVGDLEIERKLGDTLLDRWERELSTLVGSGALALADALANFAPDFARALPHRADDTNELPDDVASVAPRGLRRGAR